MLSRFLFLSLLCWLPGPLAADPGTEYISLRLTRSGQPKDLLIPVSWGSKLFEVVDRFIVEEGLDPSPVELAARRPDMYLQILNPIRSGMYDKGRWKLCTVLLPHDPTTLLSSSSSSPSPSNPGPTAVGVYSGASVAHAVYRMRRAGAVLGVRGPLMNQLIQETAACTQLGLDRFRLGGAGPADEEREAAFLERALPIVMAQVVDEGLRSSNSPSSFVLDIGSGLTRASEILVEQLTVPLNLALSKGCAAEQNPRGCGSLAHVALYPPTDKVDALAATAAQRGWQLWGYRIVPWGPAAGVQWGEGWGLQFATGGSVTQLLPESLRLEGKEALFVKIAQSLPHPDILRGLWPLLSTGQLRFLLFHHTFTHPLGPSPERTLQGITAYLFIFQYSCYIVHPDYLVPISGAFWEAELEALPQSLIFCGRVGDPSLAHLLLQYDRVGHGVARHYLTKLGFTELPAAPPVPVPGLEATAQLSPGISAGSASPVRGPALGRPALYLFYMVYHDDASLAHIRPKLRPWMRLLHIPSTLFFESFAYHLVATRHHEWAALDYVGLLTYSAEEKRPGLFDGIERVMARGVDADILAWADDSGKFSDLLTSASSMHGPAFKDVWETLFIWDHPGLALSDGDAHQRQYMFYNNYVSFKTALFPRYYSFLSGILGRALAEPGLADLLYTDSSYSASKRPVPADILSELSGRPYYTWHAFVVERLPGAFAALNNLRLYLHGNRALVDNGSLECIARWEEDL